MHLIKVIYKQTKYSGEDSYKEIVDWDLFKSEKGDDITEEDVIWFLLDRHPKSELVSWDEVRLGPPFETPLYVSYVDSRYFDPKLQSLEFKSEVILYPDDLRLDPESIYKFVERVLGKFMGFILGWSWMKNPCNCHHPMNPKVSED